MFTNTVIGGLSITLSSFLMINLKQSLMSNTENDPLSLSFHVDTDTLNLLIYIFVFIIYYIICLTYIFLRLVEAKFW